MTEATYEAARDLRWFRKDLATEDRYKYVLDTANRIRKASEWRKAQDVGRIRLYGSTSQVGSGIAGTTRPSMGSIGSRRKVGYNVIRCVTDAFTAKVTKEEPKVSFVTQRGDWQLQQKARGMESFVDGIFYEVELYQIAPQVVRDGGGIHGKGFLKWYIDGEGEDARIACERVMALELLVDDQEAIRGNPRNLYQEQWVDRVVLEEAYADEPEKLDAIHKARSGHDPHTGVHMTIGYDSTADQILVVEAWHLKSGRAAKDGRRTMVIEGCTLEDEEWPHPWFPFVTYEKEPSPLGWWGMPISDDLDAIQESMNRKIMRLDEAANLLGSGHLLVHSGSKVNFSQWDNAVGSKITYTGIKPEFFMPQDLVPAQLYTQIDRDYSRCFGLTGTPEAEAQGMVPSNLESGKAQEVHLDVTDQRINVAIKRYHHMFLQCARVVLELGREIVRVHNPKFGAKAVTKGGLRPVLLSEVDLDDEEFILKKWPTNLLSDTPEVRMGQVEKMSNAGWIAPDQAKRMLDYPDVQHENDLENASYNAVEQCISDMLEDGRYQPPMPFLNLAQAMKQVQLALIKGWSDGRPESRLQLLRDWLSDAKALPNMFGAAPTQTMASAPGTPVAAAPAAGVTPATGPVAGGGLPPGGAPPAAPMAA